MATVAEVMDDVALECAIAVPNSWIAAITRRTYQEMHSILRITVEELLDRVDWPDPVTKDVTITGTGVEQYDLPDDFKRLTFDRGAVYETTMNRRPCIPVTTNAQWTYLDQHGSAMGERFYRTGGNDADGFTIDFYRPLETDSEVIASYVSKNWLTHEGTQGFAWNSVEDTLLLPSELIRMGCVWRFKRRKGLPYESIMGEYEGKLARLANESRGKRKICFGPSSEPRNPFDIPVPDYIPSS